MKNFEIWNEDVLSLDSKNELFSLEKNGPFNILIL